MAFSLPVSAQTGDASVIETVGAATSADRDVTRLLIEANINPRTGLATDYLNHFNEAIMLLEMIPDIPECAADFLAWTPKSYREHFAASHFTGRDLAVAAYEASNPATRDEFDRVVSTMTSILRAVGEAMRDVQAPQTHAVLAGQAVTWVKPLAASARSIINGTGGDADVESIMKA
jgi:hypothetical protein